MSTLSSGIVSKYDFWTCKHFLPEKGLLGKAAKIKRFEYSPLCSEMKQQITIVKDQYKFFKYQIKFNINDNNKEKDENK